MTKWDSSASPVSWTPIFRLHLSHTGQHLGAISSGAANRVVYGSQQAGLCSHCVSANLDQLLRNVPGYDGRNITAACPTRGFPRGHQR